VPKVTIITRFIPTFMSWDFFVFPHDKMVKPSSLAFVSASSPSTRNRVSVGQTKQRLSGSSSRSSSLEAASSTSARKPQNPSVRSRKSFRTPPTKFLPENAAEVSYSYSPPPDYFNQVLQFRARLPSTNCWFFNQPLQGQEKRAVTCNTNQGRRTLARRVFHRVIGVEYNSPSQSVRSDFQDRFCSFFWLSDRHIFPGGSPTVRIRILHRSWSTLYEVASRSKLDSSLRAAENGDDWSGANSPLDGPRKRSNGAFERFRDGVRVADNELPELLPGVDDGKDDELSERIHRKRKRENHTPNVLHKKTRFELHSNSLTASAAELFKSRVCSNTYYYRYSDSPRRTGAWLAEEQQRFWTRVKEFGISDQWGLFSQGVPGRNGAQCYAFYQRWLRKHGRTSGEHSFEGSMEVHQESDDESEHVAMEEEPEEEDPYEQEDDEEHEDDNLQSSAALPITRRFSARLQSLPSAASVGIKASLRSHAATTRL